MGCGIDFVCKTCRKSYYMGYGSYSTWIHEAEAKDGLPSSDTRLTITKNRNFLKLANEHSGHDWTTANWDFHSVIKGRLEFDGAYDSTVLIPDYGDYERIREA